MVSLDPWLPHVLLAPSVAQYSDVPGIAQNDLIRHDAVSSIDIRYC